MQTCFREFLGALGMKLLTVALAVLPKDSPERIGALRGLAEQRVYERYRGYTLLLGGRPYYFDKWREIFSTLRLKTGGAH